MRCPLKTGKLLALKKKIKDEQDISVTIKEMASQWDHMPSILIDALIERFESEEQKNCPIQPFIIVDLLIIFRNPRIFRVFVQKRWFPQTPSFYCKALKAGLNAKHIEVKLCEFLERELHAENSLYVKEILYILRDYGSIDCLADLQRIEYDAEKKFSDARKTLYRPLINPDSPLTENDIHKCTDNFLAKLIISYEEILSEAIKSIIRRDEPINEDWLMDFEDFSNLKLGSSQQHGVDERQIIKPTVIDLLKDGEGKRVEFKESFRGGLQGKNAAKPEWRIAKVIASFANTDGGTLLIGVQDDKTVIGINNDFDSVNGEQDKYQLRLNQVIDKAFGGSFTPQHVDITFPEYNSILLCMVTVTRSDENVFLKKYDGNESQFWIRNAGVTKELKDKEMTKYVKSRDGQPPA